MRFTYLDILEQCFHERFRGYSKQEVDTFLQLVAEDFKEMTDESKHLRSDNERKKRKIMKLEEKLRISKESSKKINEDDYDHVKSDSQNFNGVGPTPPEVLTVKAQEIIEKAKKQADNYKQDAEKELRRLRSEINHLKSEKKDLLETFKASARDYLASLKDKKNGVFHADPNEKT